MVAGTSVAAVAPQRVTEIPGLTHSEAGRLAQREYERVQALLELLAGEDWSQPTYCTEWNVRDMVAHLAGSVTESTSFAEFRRQTIQNPYLKLFDKTEDAINKLHVEERRNETTADLVAEFRRKSPIAIINRQKLPWLIRKIHLPMGSLGVASVEYLMDTIYSRDQ